VLAQRLRMVQAALLRAELIARHGESGAFPSPQTLARLDLDLPDVRESTCERSPLSHPARPTRSVTMP
jgi:hypothetical protein